jgi:hypothetical protein
VSPSIQNFFFIIYNSFQHLPCSFLISLPFLLSPPYFCSFPPCPFLLSPLPCLSNPSLLQTQITFCCSAYPALHRCASSVIRGSSRCSEIRTRLHFTLKSGFGLRSHDENLKLIQSKYLHPTCAGFGDWHPLVFHALVQTIYCFRCKRTLSLSLYANRCTIVF